MSSRFNGEGKVVAFEALGDPAVSDRVFAS